MLLQLSSYSSILVNFFLFCRSLNLYISLCYALNLILVLDDDGDINVDSFLSSSLLITKLLHDKGLSSAVFRKYSDFISSLDSQFILLADKFLGCHAIYCLGFPSVVSHMHEMASSGSFLILSHHRILSTFVL